LSLLAAAVLLVVLVAQAGAQTARQPTFTDDFRLDDCTFASRGQTTYFILEPGYQLVLAGRDEGEEVNLTVTVLDETRRVGAVETRVVEERETEGGELVEISRNFFAFCRETSSVFYFGEEVDIYEGGVVVDHEGAWLHGVDGARAGLMMLGLPVVGARYYQEIAPGVALDRAEVVSLTETCQTPAGAFQRCLVTEETTPLEPGVREAKRYAPGIGLIQDGPLLLVSHSPTPARSTGPARPEALRPATPGNVGADRRYFPETQHTLGGGFRAYWEANGGLAIFGLPLTEEFTEVSPADGREYTVQYFERARFEHHPEHAGTPHEVQLGMLGRQALEARGWLP
jgi:hypothetical protein